MLPTLVECAKVKHIGKKPLDGLSLAPLLLGHSAEWKDRVLINAFKRRPSARSQQFRLDSQGRLYDMQADPGQHKNIANKHAEVTARLKKAVDTWQDDIKRSHSKTPGAFTVGHPGATYTQLPARDAQPHGNIRRSNHHPNNTFMNGWRTTDDKITWDVDVLAAGLFEVAVYYTCPKGQEGSTVELALGDARTSGIVKAVHDPPLTGAEHDRSKRTESYVKDFRPLSLGRIRLTPGRGQLTLRARKIPDSYVMDMRLLMLKRVEE